MRRRQGFTITELLVALALILFIMVIMTEAFSVALDTFRQLKAIGDMEERMRNTTIILRRDLQADHFEDRNGRLRLSEIDLRTDPPPDAGFFRVWQGTAPIAPNPPPGLTNIAEGLDSDGIPSARASTHMLHFTVRVRSNRPENWFSAPAPFTKPGAVLDEQPSPDFQQSNLIRSPWAEVAYYLKPLTTSTGTGKNGGASVPLFALYRRQLVVMANTTSVNTNVASRVPVASWPQYANVSCRPELGAGATNLYFNSPEDLTIPFLRFGNAKLVNAQQTTQVGQPAVAPAGTNPNYRYPVLGEAVTDVLPAIPANDPTVGDELLMTDVISFQVKILRDRDRSGLVSDPVIDLNPTTNLEITKDEFEDVPNPATKTQNANPGFATLLGRAFDTWSRAAPTAQNGNTDFAANWQGGGGNNHLAVPIKARIMAIKITIRVWDAKTQLTRQITIIQDM